MDGFKCYTNKTVVKNLDRSFTAITGLNGSGKSNIVDAIVFTLDLTSSRQMRVSVLKELINIARKECTVTLVFDNTEKEKCPAGYDSYSEIEISRSLDVEGKSKYRINGHPATKGSIENLCKCMGITGDFVVMQGQITKIVNMKKEELKSMIEETAGTKNYSEEREKSLSLLEKKEFKLREAREHLKRTISPFFEELKREKQNYEENKELEMKREEYEKELEQLERELVEAELSEHTEELRRIGNQYCKDKEELKRLEDKMKARGGVNKGNRIRGERERLEVLKKELRGVTEQLEEKNMEEESLKDKENVDKSTLLGQLREKEKILSRSLISDNGTLRELEGLKIERSKNSVELEMLKRDHRKVSDRDICILEENEERIKKLEKLDYEISQLTNKLIYPIIEGVYGTVDENFEIIDEKYKDAILTALGGRGKFVISIDDVLASKIIQNSERKISCIPLNKISYSEPKRVPYRCINAVEGIRYKKEVEGAMKYIFGGFYLFEDKKKASECCFECGVMCITVDGTVYDPRGTLTGGKSERRIEVVRQVEIKRLEEERRSQQEQQMGEEELKRQREAVKEEKRIKEIERGINDIEDKIKMIEGLIKSSIDIKGELKKIREKIIEVSKENQREEEKKLRKHKIKEEIEELNKRKAEIEREIKIGIDLIKEGENEIEEEPNIIEDKIKELISITVKLRSKISRLLDEIKNISKNIENNNDIIDNIVLIEEFKIEGKIFNFKSNSINKKSHEEKIIKLKKIISKNPITGMDPSCFELLEKNAAIIHDLECKIQKLESDKLEIIKSIEKLNVVGLKENSRAFQHINKTLPIFLSYFLKNSDACINENYEICIKIGTWKNSLGELSGGQKSLVALCLIFSMLTFKSAPFYIFDEIDAALDLNYTQFIGEIIKKEFKGAQFIVVSLKNNMFDSANRVFRVFIEEQRSKICAIK